MFSFFLPIILASDPIDPSPNLAELKPKNTENESQNSSTLTQNPKLNITKIENIGKNTSYIADKHDKNINSTYKFHTDKLVLDNQTDNIDININLLNESTNPIEVKTKMYILTDETITKFTKLPNTPSQSLPTIPVISRTPAVIAPPTNTQTFSPTRSPNATPSISPPTPSPNPSPTLSTPPCRGKNRERVDGKCVCAAGFESDDESPDCFKCPRCGDNAVCARPGRCVCIDGFIASGKECVRAPPILRSITPIECGRSERCRVNVTVDPIDPTETAFCRFGNVIVNADAIAGTSISCLAPLLEASVVDVHVSFDARHWSESAGQLTLLSKRPAPFGWLWPTAGFALAFVVVFALVFILRSSDNRHSEFYPLYKSHGHAQNARHRTVL